MLQINTTSGAPIDKKPQPAYASIADRAAQLWRTYAVDILRLLILMLVGLLFVLMGLVLITGHTVLGSSIIAGVLLISLGAAQFDR